MSGYVAISRDLWRDPDFDDGQPFTKREAWIWMIAEAEWRPRKVRRGDSVIDLGRGQFAHSLRFVAEAWGWHRNKVGRFYQMLENRDIIRTDTGTGVTLVTLCQYDSFQAKPNGGGTDAGQPAGQERDSSGTNKNQDNQFNQDSGAQSDEPETEVRARKLPDDFPGQAECEAAIKYWASKGRAYLAQRIETECLKFRAHHEAKGTKSKAWSRNWQTWYVNQVQFEENSGRPASFPAANPAAPDGSESPRQALIRKVRRYVESECAPTAWLDIIDGPAPGRPGCKVPADVLREGGFDDPQQGFALIVGGGR